MEDEMEYCDNCGDEMPFDGGLCDDCEDEEFQGEELTRARDLAKDVMGLVEDKLAKEDDSFKEMFLEALDTELDDMD